MNSVPQSQPTALDTIVQTEIEKGFEFRLSPTVHIELTFKDVCIWVEIANGRMCKKTIQNKFILKNLSGQFKAGTATAILGSSGSGKTTLLNYLSSRMQDSKLKSNGELFINGNSVHSILQIKHRTGFVNQFDILYPELTAREQLLFTARLSGIPNPEAKVNEILGMLGLMKCSDTRVGNEVKRGVSGGERKRIAIGVELITDPSLLFLDEPTTGLDSKSALDVASVLKKLSENGRSVISTIHSPSAEIMEKFDRVICLCRGEIIYDGSPLNIISHFHSIGFEVPPLTNPADHLMTIINEDDVRISAMKRGIDLSEMDVKSDFQNRIELFVKTCKAGSLEIEMVRDQPSTMDEVSQKNHNTSALSNFFIVLTRCLLIYYRNPQCFRTKVIQHLGFAFFAIILLSTTTKPEENTQAAISDVGGMAFNVASTMCFAGVFSNLYTFIPALPTFRRESQNKLYGPLTFFFTHALFEIPFQFILTNLYLLMLFWSINMRNDSFKVYIEYLVLFTCIKFSSAGLGDLLSVGIKRMDVINQMFSVLVVPLFLVSGFLANVKSITWHMKIYSYLSFFRFGFQGVINIEFTDEVRAKYLSLCVVPKASQGSDLLRLCDPRTNYDFYEGTGYLWSVLILLAQGVFFRIFAIIATIMFTKETNIVNDTIPEEFIPVIQNRKEMKYAVQGNKLRNLNPPSIPKGSKKNMVSPVEREPLIDQIDQKPVRDEEIAMEDLPLD